MTNLKGKPLSLASKIVAAAFVSVAVVLNWALGWGIPVWEILAVGGFLAAVFAGVDASLIMEKFSKKE